MYILQDPKWVWDDDIVLDWQEDITAHFLDCCKPHYTEDAINTIAKALKDGQQLKNLEDTNIKEAGDLSEEGSDHATIKQSDYKEVGNVGH